MNSKVLDVQQIRDQVRPHLASYLASHGIDINGQGKFKCFVHDDSVPSAHIWNTNLWKCFGCSASGDVIDACIAIEGKPNAGAAWVSETLLYLADQFGIPVPVIDMSPEEQRELDIYRAHAQASRLLLTMKPSDAVKAKIEEYGWKERTLQMYGIGGVPSTAEYLKKMQEAGYTREFLRQIDLDNVRIFSPNSLIYSIKDEHGNTVGFSARNLTYDAALAAAKQITEEKGIDSPEALVAREEIPQKYINSKQSDDNGTVRNPIYQKSKRLHGVHTLKGARSLYIFEGNADVVTAFNAGQKNTAALCTNKLSKDHLNLIFDLGINHLIFVMDGDAGGSAGVQSFVKLMDEYLTNRPGFNVQLVFMTDGDDPDSFIRRQGLTAFQDLPKTSVFYWRMKQAVEAGDDPEAVAQSGVGYIVNETDPIIRYGMLTQLATVTGIPYDVLNSSVQDVLSASETLSNEEISAMAERLSLQLKKSPRNAIEIIAGAAVEVERMKRPVKGVTTQGICDALDHVFGKYEAAVESVGLKTRWPLFNKLFGGIPVGPAFLTMPGKPNQGKTSAMSTLAVDVLDLNDDAIVMFHSVDDHLLLLASRLCAIKYGYPSQWFQTAGKYIQDDLKFRQTFYESKEWIQEMSRSGRFLPLDVTMLPRTINSLEAKVKSLRTKHPSKPIFTLGDNFHLYQDGMGSPDVESKTRNMSMACKTMANTLETCLMMTMELPKGSLKPGERPRMANIKGTAGISYDSSANLGVYNDMKDFRELSNMVWKDKDGIIKPVVELVFDKSKIASGFDGNIYYKLDPQSGRFDEIPESEQAAWAAKAAMKPGAKPSSGLSARPALSVGYA
jgi:DNA primase